MPMTRYIRVNVRIISFFSLALSGVFLLMGQISESESVPFEEGRPFSGSENLSLRWAWGHIWGFGVRSMEEGGR